MGVGYNVDMDGSGETLKTELHRLVSRIAELEQLIRASTGELTTMPIAPMSPAIFSQERFAGKVVSDNRDGSYQVRRQVAAGGNVFVDDNDDVAIITAYNIAERSGYSGMYSVGDIVHIWFDGFDGADNPIYHIWL